MSLWAVCGGRERLTARSCVCNVTARRPEADARKPKETQLLSVAFQEAAEASTGEAEAAATAAAEEAERREATAAGALQALEVTAAQALEAMEAEAQGGTGAAVEAVGTELE